MVAPSRECQVGDEVNPWEGIGVDEHPGHPDRLAVAAGRDDIPVLFAESLDGRQLMRLTVPQREPFPASQTHARTQWLHVLRGLRTGAASLTTAKRCPRGRARR